MIHPSRTLLDILPRVSVGGDQGILSPGSLKKVFSLRYSQGNTAAISWRVPLNTTPAYYRGFPEDGLPTSASFVWMRRYQTDLAEEVAAQTPDQSYQGGNVVMPTWLPAISGETIRQAFDYDTTWRIWNLVRAPGYGSLSLVMGTLKSYLEGYVPFLDEYGESMEMGLDTLRSEESGIFNYPKNFLENRYINSNIIRILKELSKTPVTFMILPGEDPEAFIDATSTGLLCRTNAALVNIANQAPTIRRPFRIPRIATTQTQAPTPESFLHTTIGTNRWDLDLPGHQTRDTPIPAILTWNITRHTFVETQWDGYLNYVKQKQALVAAITSAVGRLKGSNIPTFVIPKEYGGGNKYIAVVPDTYVQGDGTLDDDVLFIGVPVGFLAATSYPYTAVGGQNPARFIPYNPVTTAYVVGSPGVFNFSPAGSTPGLLSELEDFNRLAREGWADRNTYWSARAPLGAILSSPRRNVPEVTNAPPQAGWFLNSQDTIKIISCGWQAQPAGVARSEACKPVARSSEAVAK